jgi:dihydrolipoamide dehydrogenase
MLARKDKVVKELTENVRKLLEGNKIEIIQGAARLPAPGPGRGGPRAKRKKQTLSAKHILLATGSAPIEVKGLEFDGKHIVSSTGALDFDAVPKHLGIVGGGYIGLELGSVWMPAGRHGDRDRNAAQDRHHPRRPGGADPGPHSCGRAWPSGSTPRWPEAKVVRQQGQGRAGKQADRRKMTFDRLLVSVGRRPLTEGLGHRGTGHRHRPKTGQILVDETYRTSVDGIYAIGDLVPGPMLAHKASAEGTAAVECMAGRAGEVNYDTIPAVVYTWPEVASVGLTEEQVGKEIPYCVGSFPFSGAGRARCMGETDGFVKLISHGKTDRILGVHIIGPRAADMIAECVLALEFGASSEDISRTIHGHPTFCRGAAGGGDECQKMLHLRLLRAS